MRSDKPVVLIALILCAVLVAGEVSVFVSGSEDYDSSISLNGGDISYSVTSSGSNTYDVIVTDNGTVPSVTKLYLYQDSSYAVNMTPGRLPVGPKELTVEYYMEQLVSELKYRGFTDITIVDAEGFADLCSGTSEGVGIVVVSGALPSTVYTDDNDLLLDWIGNGGTLYWAGNVLGKYIADGETLKEAEEDYCLKFTGVSNSICETDASATGTITSNAYQDLLGLQSSDMTFGIKTGVLTSEYLAVGYTDGDCAGTVFVKNGSGGVCVLSGYCSNEQRQDMAQVICAGLTYSSTVAGTAEGTVTRDTESGTITLTASPGDGIAAYVVIGKGDGYPVYGKIMRGQV